MFTVNPCRCGNKKPSVYKTDKNESNIISCLEDGCSEFIGTTNNDPGYIESIWNKKQSGSMEKNEQGHFYV